MKYLFIIISVLAIEWAEAQPRWQTFMERGDAWMEVHAYQKAIDNYKQVLEWKHHDTAMAGIAESYQKLRQPRKALHWYKRLQEQSAHYLLEYGMMLKRTGQYKKARHALERFLKQHPEDKQARWQLASVDSALHWKSLSPEYRIRHLPKINTPYTEVAPVIHQKGLVFSSNREQTLIKKKIGKANAPHFDLLLAKGEALQFKSPVLFSADLNTLHHEGAATFATDHETIYFTRSEGGHDYSRDGVRRLKLYKASKGLLGWSSPLVFYMNDSTSSFGHPYISSDQQLFFFASDMPGGYGGTDLYFCLRQDSVWSAPRNLGPKVNTKGNELYPYLDEKNSVLYFSSDGHTGMGGFDLFEARIVNGEFQKVRNLRPPLNSPADDLSIYFKKSGAEGYFSSNREGGKGREDIYYFKAR